MTTLVEGWHEDPFNGRDMSMGWPIASVEPGDEEAAVIAVEDHCKWHGEDHRERIRFVRDDLNPGNILILCRRSVVEPF